MRYCLLLLPALLVLLIAACGEDEKIAITFENNSDSMICWYKDEDTEGLKGSCTELGPQETVTLETSCSDPEEVRVILAEGRDGEVHYRRKSTCPFWDGATVTISHDGERFVITDELTDPFAQ